MGHYEHDWPVLAMIKKYLQSRRCYARRKLKQGKQPMDDTDVSAKGDPDDEGATFDPRAALQAKNMRKDEDDTAENPTTTCRADTEAEKRDVNASLQEKAGSTMNQTIHATTDNTHSSKVLMTPDNDPLSVFMDEDAFFLDHRGSAIEATYDAKDQKYKLSDGSVLILDAWPDSLDNYKTCFDDGVHRTQNTFGHWRVGSISGRKTSHPSPRQLLKNSSVNSHAKYFSDRLQSVPPGNSSTTRQKTPFNAIEPAHIQSASFSSVKTFKTSRFSVQPRHSVMRKISVASSNQILHIACCRTVF
ncbi:hypothetical protein JB92DRAFT_1665640 [Gautieria morchelliformis]|nr:hypothetical protein JB92DRAFT_1665640 [Gautieria morchelliformis]